MTVLKRVCARIRVDLSHMVDDVYVVSAARVPIIKLRARVPDGCLLDVDINVNNVCGVYNTHLCYHYAAYVFTGNDLCMPTQTR
jgi:DNA polymerase sigma